MHTLRTYDINKYLAAKWCVWFICAWHYNKNLVCFRWECIACFHNFSVRISKHQKSYNFVRYVCYILTNLFIFKLKEKILIVSWHTLSLLKSSENILIVSSFLWAITIFLSSMEIFNCICFSSCRLFFSNLAFLLFSSLSILLSSRLLNFSSLFLSFSNSSSSFLFLQ